MDAIDPVDATADPADDQQSEAVGVGARAAVLGAVLLAALAVALFESLAVGARPLSLPDVWSALVEREPGRYEHDVIWFSRLPRTVAGLVVGAAIAVSGALIQAVTRNPLADPGILGVNAGAALAMALGASLFGIGTVDGQLWTAFLGALVASVAVSVIGVAGGGSNDPVRLTLAGVALAAVLSGLTTGITLLDAQAFDAMRHWHAGSLQARGLAATLHSAPFVALGLLLTVGVARSLDAVALGDDLATGLGVRIGVTRAVSVLAVTLCCGAATAIAGPIGFVGLVVPHLVRWVIGPNQSWILALSVLAGPALLLGADILARVMVPGEMPVGIVTALVGAPVLIAMSRRRRAVGL